MLSKFTEYKINPHGMYALYRVHGKTQWRESASVTNKQLENDNG